MRDERLLNADEWQHGRDGSHGRKRSEPVDFVWLTKLEGTETAMSKHQRGFTLIELVVVIVILGILAATALPRFVNLQTDAKVAAVQGIAGGLRGAIGLAQAKWQVAGGSGVSQIDMSGTTVDVGSTTGYPDGSTTGIGNAMSDCTTGAGACQGATATFGATSTFTPSGVGAGVTTCRAEYVASTGAVTAVTGGC